MNKFRGTLLAGVTAVALGTATFVPALAQQAQPGLQLPGLQQQPGQQPGLQQPGFQQPGLQLPGLQQQPGQQQRQQQPGLQQPGFGQPGLAVARATAGMTMAGLTDAAAANFTILQMATTDPQLLNRVLDIGAGQAQQPGMAGMRIVNLAQNLQQGEQNELRQAFQTSDFLQRYAQVSQQVIRNNPRLMQALQTNNIQLQQVAGLDVLGQRDTIFVLGGIGQQLGQQQPGMGQQQPGLQLPGLQQPGQQQPGLQQQPGQQQQQQRPRG